MDLSKHWKTIVDTLQDGLIVVDPGGRIVSVNPAAAEMTGYSADELVGQSCRVLGCTGCKIKGGGGGEQWCGLFDRGRVGTQQCTIRGRNRRSIHIMKSARVLRDADGRVIGAVETLKDMSQVFRQQQEIAALRRSCLLDRGYHGIIGESPKIQRLFELIESVAPSDAPVLVLGQSGTGKELVARAIHDAGHRKDGPFIKVNCAALNENLLESELFGHVKGAYTGAERARVGRFEAAHGGSILLDEIGDIPLTTQVKLLRVLEEREIERVGDHQTVGVDVRIITATNRNLEELIRKGSFREDLFFRINVFPIHCPSLAERADDIPLIVQNFIEQYGAKAGKKILGLTSDAMEALTGYAWPGNVRELRNAVEYAFVLCPGEWIGVEHLPPKIVRAGGGTSPRPEGRPDVPANQRERDALIQALRQSGGNQSETARLLNVSRVTVWKRIKKYGIDLGVEIGKG
ncbi:sigma-54 interaction domain-containing protein [Desulfococcus sp.]|uniref:sigma-54 interaction domain-containing protein n=1 Tax=Desulfococcus sp. TaxID=2025834 RepID=UPI0035930885